jgi:hypothetical protein
MTDKLAGDVERLQKDIEGIRPSLNWQLILLSSQFQTLCPKKIQQHWSYRGTRSILCY